jgi:hypothetical protein
MQNKKEINSVNARRLSNIQKRHGGNGPLEDSVAEPDTPFPYLEDVMAAARKHPYAALGAMIGVAGIVVAAIVTVAVSVFTGMFLMYGTMKETTTNQIQIQQSLIAIQKQQTDDMNAVRAYESNISRRTEFIVGLMTPQQQKSVAEYDAVNPRIELPNTKIKREQ